MIPRTMDLPWRAMLRDVDMGDGQCGTCGAPASLWNACRDEIDPACPDCGAPQRATRPDMGDGPMKGTDDDISY